MACNMAWPPAQGRHAIEQMAQGASCKKESISSCEVAPVKPRFQICLCKFDVQVQFSPR